MSTYNLFAELNDTHALVDSLFFRMGLLDDTAISSDIPEGDPQVAMVKMQVQMIRRRLALIEKSVE